jgi:hypothetical protein
MTCPYLKSCQMLRNRLPSCFLFRRMVRNGVPRVCFYVCSMRNGIRVVFSSSEWFRTESQEFASMFVPWDGIPSCFLFCIMVQNGIPRVFFFFVSWYRIPSIFIFHELVGNGIPRVSFPRKSRNLAGTNQLFRLFCLPRKIFLSEIANPTCKLVSYITMKLSQVSVPAPLYTDSSFSKMCYVIVLTNS